MSKLDLTKPIQTRDGKPVEIITTNGRDERYPIIGYMGTCLSICLWTADGSWNLNCSGHHHDDLVNVPESKPTPVIAPLGPEDVPPGSVLRRSDWDEKGLYVTPSVWRSGVSFVDAKNCCEYSYDGLMHGWEINRSLPLGKWDATAWEPCHKEAQP